MNPFLAGSAEAVALSLILLSAIPLIGFAITRLHSRRALPAAWLLTIVSVAGAERLTAAERPGYRMIVIIVALFLAMKSVVAVAARQKLSFGQWLRFSLAWPGMRPSLFAAPTHKRPLPGWRTTFLWGLTCLLIGFGIIAAIRFGWKGASGFAEIPRTLLLLCGISLMLHFGLFNLAVGFWRLRGVDAYPLFRAPLRSRSLAEFWGRRWNLPFTEMTSLVAYRPLKKSIGVSAALVASFVLSGLLHEVAISLPVRAGFGLPLLYFLLHAALVTIERRTTVARFLDRSRVLGVVWTIGWLLLPLPILFHRPFLQAIVLPIAQLSSRA